MQYFVIFSSLDANQFICLYIVLYKEYQDLKSKTLVGSSKNSFVTDSKNSVFGAHLNKGKLPTKKKSSVCPVNSKALSWSKHHGWMTLQNMANNSKLSETESREESKVRM